MTATEDCRCGRGDEPARATHPRRPDCLAPGMARSLPARWARILPRLIHNAKELERYGVTLTFPPDFAVHPYRRRVVPPPSDQL